MPYKNPKSQALILQKNSHLAKYANIFFMTFSFNLKHVRGLLAQFAQSTALHLLQWSPEIVNEIDEVFRPAKTAKPQPDSAAQFDAVSNDVPNTKSRFW